MLIIIKSHEQVEIIKLKQVFWNKRFVQLKEFS